MKTDRELSLSDAGIAVDSAESMLSYPVLVGAGAIEAATELCKPFQRMALVADKTVLELHGERLGGLRDLPIFELTPGEANKNWERLGEILEFMSTTELSRDSLLLTFGGGMTGDMGGLAASLFKRGIAVGHLPSTLLSQVDASVGGKTAVNLPAGKNLAGTFHPPRFVLADLDLLKTQSTNEWRSGLGEVVKTALLARAPLFEDLESVAPSLTEPGRANTKTLTSLVRACIRAKAQWVQADPTEQGSRKALNLGHTFGHAIEHAAGYGAVPHGIAVAMGMILAVRASRAHGTLLQEDLEERLTQLLRNLGLPCNWSEWSKGEQAALSVQSLIEGLAHDKKGQVAKPRFVLPQAVEKVLWDQELDPNTLSAIIEAWLV